MMAHISSESSTFRSNPITLMYITNDLIKIESEEYNQFLNLRLFWLNHLIEGLRK